LERKKSRTAGGSRDLGRERRGGKGGTAKQIGNKSENVRSDRGIEKREKKKVGGSGSKAIRSLEETVIGERGEKERTGQARTAIFPRTGLRGAKGVIFEPGRRKKKNGGDKGAHEFVVVRK